VISTSKSVIDYDPRNYGSGIHFIWEFEKVSHSYLEVGTKRKTVDEMLGMVGGVMGLLFSFFGYFMHPLSTIEFVIANQSAKEEINLVMKQGLC
jgi:zinc transporter ZupT